jgi:hypothetical protein
MVTTQQSLADQILEGLGHASEAKAAVGPRDPGGRPKVDVDPAIDAATGSDGTTKTDLALKGWAALSPQQQKGIIGGASSFGGLFLLFIAGCWFFRSDEEDRRGLERREKVKAFCKRCMPGGRP